MQNLADYVLKADEYEKGGSVFCKKCNTERGFSYNGRFINCNCECMNRAYEEKKAAEEKQKRVEYFKNLQQNSLIGKRFLTVNFDDTEKINTEFEKVLNRCKKYCENADKALSEGYGMYIYGDCGTGKTHLTACMANYLLAKLNSVLFTNFFEIAKSIKQTFSKSLYTESEYINNLAEIDFLFIDDIGTEVLQRNGEMSWIQEKMYDVLNKRYNAKKPTIFTSNYSLQQLIEERGIMDKITSRISEMANAIIELKGEDYRLKNKIKTPF